MKSRIALLLVSCAAALVSCGGGDATSSSVFSRRSIESWSNPYAGTATESVNLTIWSGETQESVDYIKMVASDFKKANPKSNYNFTIKPVSESSVSGDWEQNPNTAADLAIAADDQIPSMVSSKRLVSLEQLSAVKIPGLKDNVVARTLPEAIDAVTQPDPEDPEVEKVYGIPVSASNGFVLYYNSKYVHADEVGSFESLLAGINRASTEAGRNLVFGYPYNSGWYLDGWFHGAGFSVTGEAGKTYCVCDWNTTLSSGVTGLDVASSMVRLAHGQYKSHWNADAETKLMTRINDDSNNQVVATISGTWNYNKLVKAWGEENTKATVLPTYHLAAKNADVRMCSVKGFKIAVINKAKANAPAAARFAEFLANYESQVLRYDFLNEAPANLDARTLIEKEELNPVVKAINDQWETSFVEKVNPTYWNPSNGLSVQLADQTNGDLIVSGDGTAAVVLNEAAIQAALDACVASLAPAAA